MSKLKTLKDFTIHGGSDKFGLISKKDLKQEAIKWVKAHSDNFPRPLDKDWTREWIKHFFNLIEEDLIEVENE